MSEKAKQGAQVPGSSASAIPETASGSFHVFTWLDSVQLASGSKSAGQAIVQQHLGEVDGYLVSSTKLHEKSAYKRCNLSTRQIVHSRLEEQGQTIGNSEDEGKIKDYSQRVDIYNAAELVFHFFLPDWADQDVPTVGKFWGAILRLVEVCLRCFGLLYTCMHCCTYSNLKNRCHSLLRSPPKMEMSHERDPKDHARKPWCLRPYFSKSEAHYALPRE